MENVQLSRALSSLQQAAPVDVVLKNGAPTNGRSLDTAVSKSTGRESSVVKILTAEDSNLNTWVSYALTNDVGTRQLIVGSLLGLAGNAAFFGQAANCSDAAGATATDSAGAAIASVGPVQGLCDLSVSRNMIVEEVVLDGQEAGINAIIMRYRVLHFDGTIVKDTLVPFAQFEKREDQNVTTWKIKGPFLLSELSFLQFSLTAGQNYTLRLKIPYWVGAGMFTSVGSIS